MSLTALFQSVGITYGPMLPVLVILLFALLALPALLKPGARAEAVGAAAYSYMAQMLGVLLMTAGALPALYAVFAAQPLSESTYLGLILVFAAGGGLFLWHDMRLRAIDAVSRSVPGTIFFITWKFIALLTTVLAGISFILTIIQDAPRAEYWWVGHLVMLLYGLTLCWFTLSRAATPADQAFTSVSTVSTRAAAPAVKTVKKSAPVKKKRK